MPATLPAPDTAVFAPLPTRRSAYQRVAVAPEVDHYTRSVEWWDSPVLPAPAVLRRPAAPATPPAPATVVPELRMRWLADRALREMEIVTRQLAAKQPYYESIDRSHVLATTGLLTVQLWQHATPLDLTFTLTYDQSLHVRATLPQGALHVSVLFTPGLDPLQNQGLCEEEDNTVLSVFGADGRWQKGIEGPLMQCLSELPALLLAPAATSPAPPVG